ncbi:MAG: ATP-grasp domain-containing protein [Oscillospiraceae bacterium]|nr:ATP-grasp domain-containing protein [Oscillospiraceae bacterium]
MKNNKPLVIVLARNYSTGLGVIRSLGQTGYTVDLLASVYRPGDMAIAAVSRYLRRTVTVVKKSTDNSSVTDAQAMFEKLMEYAGKYTQKPVLFPTDDYTASVVDGFKSELQQHFVLPHIVGGDDGSIPRAMNKNFQSQLAVQAGLNVPKEWIISLENIDIPQDMVYPCFCKPAESISGYKTEMKRCDSEQQLQQHLEAIAKKNAKRSVLVQEFLCIDGEYDMSGLCLDDRIIIPAVIKKTRVAQFEKGVTVAGQVVSADVLGDVTEKIKNMLRQYHFVGMFDMELNVVDGKIYFNEVNLRSGGPSYAYFECGVNLPHIMVQYLCGNKAVADAEYPAQYNKKLVYEKVAWMEYIKGYMDRAELDCLLNNSDIKLIYNQNDTAPQKLFRIKIMLSAAKNRVKKLLR